ncbi:unnamed protein product, partial [Larinioides sclopetarius]
EEDQNEVSLILLEVDPLKQDEIFKMEVTQQANQKTSHPTRYRKLGKRSFEGESPNGNSPKDPKDDPPALKLKSQNE